MPPSHPLQQRSAVVLAAGQGTRFKSRRSKVLHKLCGKPMLLHILDKLRRLEMGRVVVVVGHDADEVRAKAEDYDVEFAVQEEQKGTGHALQVAAPLLPDEGSVLVLSGDVPLITLETLGKLLEAVEDKGADESLLTALLADPSGYGRILRDEAGQVVAIREDKDATDSQRQIKEINAGFYCFKASELKPALSKLGSDNAAGEYYLTDLLDILCSQGKCIKTISTPDPSEAWGINDRRQLAQIEGLQRERINQFWMGEGVTMLDPARVLIDADVELAPDVTLFPGVILQGRTRIGPATEVRAGCHLRDARVGRACLLDQGTIIRDSEVGDETRIGPYAHLRGQARVGNRVRIGNFVEVKKSVLKDGAKAAHLTYLGDAHLGRDVNIGAGTITCNYDGKRKNRTVIEDGVFIGSNSQLIAPVTIGRGAYVAAGSTITEDVPAGALAVARSRQVVKPDWSPGED